MANVDKIFVYENWISDSACSFVFDPDLSLYKGRQYVPLNKPMFGVFADSCQDRWFLVDCQVSVEAG